MLFRCFFFCLFFLLLFGFVAPFFVFRETQQVLFWGILFVLHSIAKGSQVGIDILQLLCLAFHGLGTKASQSLLPFIIRSTPNFPLLFQLRNDASMFPSHLGRQSAQNSVLGLWLEAQDPQRLGAHHSLHLIVRRRNALECLQSSQRQSSPLGLVGNHTPHCSPQNF